MIPAGRASSSDCIEAGDTIQLVCLKGGFDMTRARVPPGGATVIVRPGISKVRPVPGEIFTVDVERSWVFGHTRHVKGLVTSSRLELQPLGLEEFASWHPEEDDWLFEPSDHPIYEECDAEEEARLDGIYPG